MTDKLEIINYVMSVVGEDPVTANSTHPTAINAGILIDGISKDIQRRGWWFNTEYDLTLSPDINGEILLPDGTLYVDPNDTSSALLKRGNKLYDPVNHTFTISDAVIVKLVLQLEIEDLPESAAMYLKYRAGYEFYVNDDGDETKSRRLQENRDKAWAELQQEQLKAADVNSNHRPTSAMLKAGIRQFGYRYNPNLPGGGR